MKALKPRNKFEREIEEIGLKVASIKTNSRVKRFSALDDKYHLRTEYYCMYTIMNKDGKRIIPYSNTRDGVKEFFSMWTEQEKVSKSLLKRIRNEAK